MSNEPTRAQEGERKRAYISGPISLGGTLSPEDIADNITAFKRAAKAVEARKYVAVDPTNIPKQHDWQSYMRIAVRWLAISDLLLTLPDAEQSIGSVWEQQIAHMLGLEVMSVMHFIALSGIMLPDERWAKLP